MINQAPRSMEELWFPVSFNAKAVFGISIVKIVIGTFLLITGIVFIAEFKAVYDLWTFWGRLKTITRIGLPVWGAAVVSSIIASVSYCHHSSVGSNQNKVTHTQYIY